MGRRNSDPAPSPAPPASAAACTHGHANTHKAKSHVYLCQQPARAWRIHVRESERQWAWEACEAHAVSDAHVATASSSMRNVSAAARRTTQPAAP